MATLVRQDPELRRTFHRLMEEAERRRRADRIDSVRVDHPIATALLAPVMRLMLWNEDMDKQWKGDSGESLVAKALRRLPEPWHYLNDVVLYREPDGYAQVDHIAVGPSGVYAVETKHWKGAILGNEDTWRIKEQGGRWKRVQSPTAQSQWHANRIRDHLLSHGVQVPVIPVTVFVDTDWVRWNNCTGLIYDGAGTLREALARTRGNSIGSKAECAQVAELIASSRPEPANQGAPAMPPAQLALDPTPPTPQDGTPPRAPQVPSSEERPASEKQRAYARSLLDRARIPYREDRLDALSAKAAQAIIDRVRFHRDVPLPPLQ